jgi:hypothetical protein
MQMIRPDSLWRVYFNFLGDLLSCSKAPSSGAFWGHRQAYVQRPRDEG